MAVVDLFAGPGGVDVALADLGVSDVLGVELDPAAARTRIAAGHGTLVADVAALDPASTMPDGVDGLVASPPCQLFSDSGHRDGVRGIELLDAAVEHAVLLAGDMRADYRQALAESLTPFVSARNESEQASLVFDNVPSSAEAEAARLAAEAMLVVEPGRWIEALRPRWVLLEQVPAVLHLWETVAGALVEIGYSVETGIVDAADYGVPQRRRRAVLVARFDDLAEIAPPTVSIGEHATSGAALGLPGGGAGWSINTGRDWKPGGSRADCQRIRCTAPAPTLTAKSGGQWRLVFGDDVDGAPLTVEQAGILQTFPVDYPWWGTKTERFRQAGNAVPPALARALLASLVEPMT